MGATADQIGREISATRDHVDQNLTILERRAMKGARRYGRMAAIGLVAGVVVASVAFLVYRPVRTKLQRRPVRVIISTADDREHGWESVARKVAPVIATSVAGAVASRIARQPGGRKKSEV